MNKLLTSLFIVAFGFGIHSVVAQSTFATIIKNVNVRAKGVKHSLNATKDTLLLESDKKINYVYVLVRFDSWVGRKEYCVYGCWRK